MDPERLYDLLGTAPSEAARQLAALSGPDLYDTAVQYADYLNTCHGKMSNAGLVLAAWLRARIVDRRHVQDALMKDRVVS